MERLQEALSRARARREQLAGAAAADNPEAQLGQPAHAARMQHRQPVGATNTMEAWRQLRQYSPNEKTLRNNRVMSFFGQQYASAFDMLRTKVVQQAKQNNWRRIVITSPSARCGKTTIAANLAFSLARQSDFRTLMVEIDMRRPELASVFGIEQNLSFARALGGHEAPADHMVAYGNNLAIAANRAPAANSSELLQSAIAKQVLTEIENTYQPDLVVYDAAPILASDDTVGFLEFADAALLVGAAEQTTIDEIDVAEAEIASVSNVLGVILNKSRYSQPNYGYEYGY